jgi:hypothetical protein
MSMDQLVVGAVMTAPRGGEYVIFLDFRVSDAV